MTDQLVTRLSRSQPAIPIADVRVRLLSVPSPEPVAMAFGPLENRTTVLIEIEADDGTIGYGESWANHPPWASVERHATILRGIRPLLLGRNGAHITALHGAMLDALLPLGHQWGAPGPVIQAVSGVDLALWDLLGKTFGLSVADMLGGVVRDTIPVYASSLGPTNVEEDAIRCRDQGFRAVKVKVGFGQEIDAENLLTARRVLGADVELLADANQNWSMDDALAMTPVLLECGVAWIEEPLRGNAVRDLEELETRTGLRIATGENVYGRAGFMPYLMSRHPFVLQPDLSKNGGFTEIVPVCQMALAIRRCISPHLYGGAIAYAATLQLAAACPAVDRVEFDVRSNPLRDPLIIDAPVPRAGNIELPTGPGLGVRIDEDAVERTEVLDP